ncbi:MAG: hypothetical protein EZS28_029058 [Streblomastix strix]|uniref:Uncharacterized protein n=1 Tax=Streblomastix strix TaxID=222440 RepID=A0A5J4V055_9EUKA|nr:MAG: hypothetical protein EZS28_029058 [Streblomastix strix]
MLGGSGSNQCYYSCQLIEVEFEDDYEEFDFAAGLVQELDKLKLKLFEIDGYGSRIYSLIQKNYCLVDKQDEEGEEEYEEGQGDYINQSDEGVANKQSGLADLDYIED